MRRPRRSYPQHPFPFMLDGRPSQSQPTSSRHLSKHQRWLIQHIRKGARVLLDLQHKKALLLSFKQGVAQLVEITIRVLSGLVDAGLLVPTTKEGRLVHFEYCERSVAG